MATLPYKTIIENTLWFIKERGPTTLRGISKALGYDDLKTISGAMSMIYDALGSDKTGAKYLSRELCGDGKKAYVYKAIVNYDPVEAYAIYKKFRNAYRASLKTKGYEMLPSDDKKSIHIKKLEEVLQQALGLQVHIEGEIKIIFQFEVPK